jgi:hypothetical protein
LSKSPELLLSGNEKGYRGKKRGPAEEVPSTRDEFLVLYVQIKILIVGDAETKLWKAIQG